MEGRAVLGGMGGGEGEGVERPSTQGPVIITMTMVKDHRSGEGLVIRRGGVVVWGGGVVMGDDVIGERW